LRTHWRLDGRLVFLPCSRIRRAESEARRTELNRLLADEWEYTLRTQPELATHIGDNRYNDRLSDFSDQAIADDLEHSRKSLRRFEAINTAGFPEQEKLNQALMVRTLRDGVEEVRFKTGKMPATQFGGIHLGYASLPFDSPFRNVRITRIICRACDKSRACWSRQWDTCATGCGNI